MKASLWLWIWGLVLIGCASQNFPLSSSTQLLPRVEQSPEGKYTVPPQVLTYAEFAQLLSTPTRQVEAHTNLRQKGILIALTNRSWDDLRRLTEYGLEVQFVKVREADGVEYWRIVRAPEAERRDTQLFNRYVQIAHQQIIDQLRQYDSWFGRPREEVKKEWKQIEQEWEQVQHIITSEIEAIEDIWEFRINPQIQRVWSRWFDGLWVQSLDGYVMFQWMRKRWTEAHTRQLIRERMVVVQQYLVSGFPGIITEGDLRDFLKSVPESELVAYDWAIGVVSWSAELRRAFPYCDIVAPHDEGTEWMLFPICLRVEPLSNDELWRQLGKEAEAYLNDLAQHQKSLAQEPTLNKPFRATQANTLSQVLEAWAKAHEREIVMELAPERERVFGSADANWTLAGLTQPDFSAWLQENTVWPKLYAFVTWSSLREPAYTDKTFHEVAHSLLENSVPRWYYETHDGVLMVRNPLAFLDRQYTYPLDALFALERALPQVGDDPHRLIEVLGAFATSVLRQPDQAPALANYRAGAHLKGGLMEVPALVLLASLPKEERQRLLRRLEADEKVRIPFQRAGTERLDAFTRFWRRTAHYDSESSEPFGMRYAWHPRFTACLRQSHLVLELNSEGNWVFSVEISLLMPDRSRSEETESLGELEISTLLSETAGDDSQGTSSPR